MLAGWLDDKGKHPGESDDQPAARRWHWPQRSGWTAGCTVSKAVLPASCWRSVSGPVCAVMRFAKGLNAFKGLYQHMFQHFVASDPGVHWLNFEQDLGLVNFRRTKLSYQPVALLAKRRATLR